MSSRLERLGAARLYLVCPILEPGRLQAALRGGVDVVQLRDKHASDAELVTAAASMREACAEAGALFLINDRPDLVEAMDADGVHVGQDDVPVSEARALIGDDKLVGLSTHSPSDLAAADADYVGVGPVHATPTKPGRPAAGLEYVRHAAEHATMPWFAIGGIDTGNVTEVVDAGARRIVVVRAIVEAQDPEGVARQLRAAVEAGVGVA